MSIRHRFPAAKLPRSHYFLTVSRGDEARAFAVRPAVAFLALSLLPLLLIWSAGATAYFAFHDQIVAGLVTRTVQVQSDYETRLADVRAELDHEKSRQLLDQEAFEGKMRDLLSRQAQLERRGAALASLAAEASANATALAELSTPHRRSGSALAALQAAGAGPTDGDLGPARAYAPVAPAPVSKPRPLDGTPDLGALDPAARRLTGELAAAASDTALEPSARVGLVGYSLDRVEREQIAAVGGFAAQARAAARGMESVISRTGLSPASLKAPEGGMGGPFIPVDFGNDAFGRAADAAMKDAATAARLRRLMPRLPLRYPLVGEVAMSSPFGYRADPFLGRAALHPGVDLVQAYGAEIKATAMGRVIHAGPMGGYGNAVDIDHGNGIVTRYGHMSEVIASEGQVVKAGDAIGRIGSTGRSTGPHLHYEVRLDGEPVDPERFLGADRGL